MTSPSFAGILGLGFGELLLIGAVLGVMIFLTAFAFWLVGSRLGPGRSAAAPRPQRKCPDCAEFVLAEARVCKHCGFRFEQAS